MLWMWKSAKLYVCVCECVFVGEGWLEWGGGTWWVLLAWLFQQQRGVTWGQISQHVACVVPLAHLDDFHLWKSEAAGGHSDTTVTRGALHTAVVISVTLIACVSYYINLIWFWDWRWWRGRRGRGRPRRVCTGYGGDRTLGDGPPLGMYRTKLFESPSQVSLLSAQVFFLNCVFSFLYFKVLYKSFRFCKKS